MNARFADTFYFFALGNKNDLAHFRALAVSGLDSPPLITTAWVLTELADGLAAPTHRHSFLRLLKEIQGNPHFEIVPPDAELFQRGLELYNQRPDKGW